MRTATLMCGALLLAGIAAAGESIRVATCAIHPGEGEEVQVDRTLLASLIETVRPDIVCLQHVPRGDAGSGKPELPTALAREFGMNLAIEPTEAAGSRQHGNATLSRFEIVSHENIPLPGQDGDERAGCLRVTVRVAERTLTILNVHLTLDPDRRVAQAASVLENGGEDPVVLAGNLGASRKGPALKLLLSRFLDTADFAASRTGEGASHAVEPRPGLILVSPGMDVLSSRVFRSPETAAASDFLLAVAEVGLREPPENVEDKGVYDTDDERVTEALVGGE